jgi:hypothetical protein
MHLTISKTQQPGPPTVFIVRIGPLTLTRSEQEQSRLYGAEALETFLAAHGGIMAVQSNLGATVSFTDPAEAERFVAGLHKACQETESYWKTADGFGGSYDYESTP